jgi:hypothetical protein
VTKPKSKILEVKKNSNGRRPSREDDLKILKVEYLNIHNWIILKYLIKAQGPKPKGKMLKMKTISHEKA